MRSDPRAAHRAPFAEDRGPAPRRRRLRGRVARRRARGRRSERRRKVVLPPPAEPPRRADGGDGAPRRPRLPDAGPARPAPPRRHGDADAGALPRHRRRQRGVRPRQHGLETSREAVAALLRQVGLAGLEDRDVEHLSGGEAQRVAIARAVANGPAVLLLDEPTSALDDAAKRDIEALLREVVRARALTCVIITHDLAQAARLATRVLVLARGRVQRIGEVREVLRAEWSPRSASHPTPGRHSRPA